ncbi:hypothetical protein C8J57DRAFT_1716428 [Mycena rebaudengoi]|nr:hypothetical protein C8J57DRAFT_1716428 [Mycena rebaudengoi]
MLLIPTIAPPVTVPYQTSPAHRRLDIPRPPRLPIHDKRESNPSTPARRTTGRQRRHPPTHTHAYARVHYLFGATPADSTPHDITDAYETAHRTPMLARRAPIPTTPHGESRPARSHRAPHPTLAISPPFPPTAPPTHAGSPPPPLSSYTAMPLPPPPPSIASPLLSPYSTPSPAARSPLRARGSIGTSPRGASISSARAHLQALSLAQRAPAISPRRRQPAHNVKPVRSQDARRGRRARRICKPTPAPARTHRQAPIRDTGEEPKKAQAALAVPASSQKRVRRASSPPSAPKQTPPRATARKHPHARTTGGQQEKEGSAQVRRSSAREGAASTRGRREWEMRVAGGGGEYTGGRVVSKAWRVGRGRR